ncbi:MAG: HpsJ family protein [Snowella sp.]|nr:HpsJ family protein [Snowella sp.]
MFPVDNDTLSHSVEDIKEIDYSFRQAVGILRWLGYGLLLFTIFDWADTLTPLQFMNPLWEFQTIGALVEKVVVPLLGFVLIFTGANSGRRIWESRLVGFLSWLTLLLGILYCLMVPLGVINTVRINEINTSQFTGQLDKQITQIREVKSQLSGVDNEAQLQGIIRTLQRGGIAITPNPGESVENIKQDLTTFIAGSEEKLKAQVKEARANQQLSLLKRSIKWNVGALIAGVWFIGIWRMTDWAR